jgi:hypothetical protein
MTIVYLIVSAGGKEVVEIGVVSDAPTRGSRPSREPDRTTSSGR